MFIQTEDTPNPSTIKFLPGQPVTGGAPVDVPTMEDADKHSPLAKTLFDISGVSSVFLGNDFVSVTKAEGKEWSVLKPRILAGIMDHYMAGLPVLNEDSASDSNASDASRYEGLDEISLQIKEILDERVRPAVAMDGGDIVFDRFEGGIVYLEMRGACSGCPSSTATLKMGIENMLKHFIPEVVEVQPVEA